MDAPNVTGLSKRRLTVMDTNAYTKSPATLLYTFKVHGSWCYALPWMIAKNTYK